MRVISLYSPWPQSGKTTFADLLSKTYPHSIRLRFAGPLKRISHQLIAEVRPELSYAEVDAFLDGDKKDSEVRYGLTGRDFMILVGTRLGRMHLHKDVWVDSMRDTLRHIHKTNRGAVVIIDDLRFPNELAMLDELGMDHIPIHVYRPGMMPEKMDPCEGQLNDRKYAVQVINDGTKESLSKYLLHYELVGL